MGSPGAESAHAANGSGPQPDTVLVDAGRLRETITQILVACGATEADASLQAFGLTEADLRGQHSHGVRRLPILVERLRNDLIRSPREARTEWVTDAVLRVDGGRGFGPPVAFDAVDRIIERGATQGIAMATVSNSNHIGMLAPYLERITGAGQIGVALTTSEALVHAWGGTGPVVGTNPIGIGLPTGAEPLILDMATSAVSMGKVLDYASRRRSIPLGWAVDEHGAQTTDAGAAARGAISPFGGVKGYALGIALEVLVATLTGSGLGTDVHGTLDAEEICNKGDVFITVSLERLGLTGFLPSVTAYLEEVRGSGVDGAPLDVPGDRARRNRAQSARDGIHLPRNSWERTLELWEEVRHA